MPTHAAQAELTFAHQLVWDPVLKVIKPLTPIPADVTVDMSFAGEWV